MVQWNADKDQIILNGIFKFYDIKSSGPLLDFLAKQIGEGCTPKAVSHRLNAIRGKANGSRNTPASAKKPPVKPALASTPKTNKSSAKKNSNKKKTPDISEESDENDDPVSPSVARTKRARTVSSYAEADDANDEDEDGDEQEHKRVKVENSAADDDEDELLYGLNNGSYVRRGGSGVGSDGEDAV